MFDGVGQESTSNMEVELASEAMVGKSSAIITTGITSELGVMVRWAGKKGEQVLRVRIVFKLTRKFKAGFVKEEITFGFAALV
ncbi:hypothetical protein GH714_014881 [Hevea brasiliensis]|uniref:Uncharacterized protein n=1 Tax=Hevea brasiliensis TaxID=3981 RepID=A0A6A6N1P6_HEVBR|nr:hypothetical protein GH714_014881 [Hevea brasiliensis]